ncbi:MAG: hypothetical protein ACJASX_003279 [Limisphaerales bacterium]|jgi:hypothetical protein
MAVACAVESSCKISINISEIIRKHPDHRLIFGFKSMWIEDNPAITQNSSAADRNCTTEGLFIS